jgi:hypothetical protein
MVALLQAEVLAQCTLKSGTIIGETWTRANSPYCIVGNILVAGLTIQPGVSIVFHGNYVFEVAGTLTAIGTPIDSIPFVKADTVAAGRGWQGIFFNNTRLGSQMRYCIVSGSLNSGIRIHNSDPQIRNCLIRDNSGPQGGGMRITGVVPLTIEGCTIVRNFVSGLHVQGGGIYCDSTLVLNDGVVEDNHLRATGQTGTGGSSLGGGIFSVWDLRLNRCLIRNNSAATFAVGWTPVSYGGGIYANGRLRVAKCTIDSNKDSAVVTSGPSNAAAHGGGVYVNGSYSYTNSFLTRNVAYSLANSTPAFGSFGGGIYANGNDSITNCIVSYNSAIVSGPQVLQQGGGLYLNSPTSIITNSTIAYNSNQGLARATGTVTIWNSILFFNTAEQIAGTAVSVSHSDVQGGFSGQGNIDANPILLSTNCPQIVPPSPCIDAGDTTRAYYDVCFVNGNRQRSWGSTRNDMGAHGGPGACGWDSSQLCIIVGVENNKEGSPRQFGLSQNFPNPFNPTTKINFSIPTSSFTMLKVFDILGKEVATLVNEELKPGGYETTWDASGFASGVYLYRLHAGGFLDTKRLLLLR